MQAMGAEAVNFPNQVNNSTGFPAIFRGALDVRATTITDEMCIAAAYELAQFAEDRGINEENISPTMSEWEVFVREAVAVGMKAQEQGVARLTFSREELTDKASKIIKETRDITAMMMKEGFIPKSPR
jgi:malate dehydrogenase (oxaloacetate-decarboxylating)